MGTGEAPRDFILPFNVCVAKWSAKLEADDDSYAMMRAACPMVDREVDLGLTAFADDLHRKHLATDSNDAVARIKHSNDTLDECIRERGYKQNMRGNEFVLPIL